MSVFKTRSPTAPGCRGDCPDQRPWPRPYLTLVLGELLPKRIGMNFAEQAAKLVARPMNVLSKIASPVVWMLSKSTRGLMILFGLNRPEENKVTEDEIKAIVREGFDSGEVQDVEQDIVERVFTLGDRDVGSIMTHRSELIWLNTEERSEEHT